jgi:2-keto-4-pentenoate hydratase/2-oxohepta-3-ene-1,7-dioic acid hydratase in catechol pathway
MVLQFTRGVFGLRFVTFSIKGRPISREEPTEAGALLDGRVVSLRGAGFADLLGVIAGGEDALGRARRWVTHAPTGSVFDRDTVRLTAPIARPGKIICIGLNYRDHAAEAHLELPTVPTVFSKFATAVIGPGEAIVLPRNSTKPDYEAEFAVVIGRRARHVSEADWRSCVFGYTILNDVSARDFQTATSQWMMGKTFDTFAPFGPAIVTADEIADPHNLRISLAINGETLQDSNTSNLIFGVPQLIAFLSSVFTLEPGDLISTGTPAGVGFARKPPRWLRPGDNVSIKIDGLGELVNPVVAEA